MTEKRPDTDNARTREGHRSLPGSRPAKITYDASPDPLLRSYQLRGHVGDEYDEEDAVVLATYGPNDPREFVTPYGLNQPGAQAAYKVFVILTTDNESGSTAMIVERPAEMSAMAA